MTQATKKHKVVVNDSNDVIGYMFSSPSLVLRYAK